MPSFGGWHCWQCRLPSRSAQYSSEPHISHGSPGSSHSSHAGHLSPGTGTGTGWATATAGIGCGATGGSATSGPRAHAGSDTAGTGVTSDFLLSPLLSFSFFSVFTFLPYACNTQSLVPLVPTPLRSRCKVPPRRMSKPACHQSSVEKPPSRAGLNGGHGQRSRHRPPRTCLVLWPILGKP